MFPFDQPDPPDLCKLVRVFNATKDTLVLGGNMIIPPLDHIHGNIFSGEFTVTGAAAGIQLCNNLLVQSIMMQISKNRGEYFKVRHSEWGHIVEISDRGKDLVGRITIEIAHEQNPPPAESGTQ